MGRSRGRGKSEVEFLKGKIRELQKEVKFLRKRSHIENSIIDDVLEDSEVQDINAEQCPQCGKGILVNYDFIFATLKKCQCGFEIKSRKK